VAASSSFVVMGDGIAPSFGSIEGGEAMQRMWRKFMPHLDQYVLRCLDKELYSGRVLCCSDNLDPWFLGQACWLVMPLL